MTAIKRPGCPLSDHPEQTLSQTLGQRTSGTAPAMLMVQIMEGAPLPSYGCIAEVRRRKLPATLVATLAVNVCRSSSPPARRHDTPSPSPYLLPLCRWPPHYSTPMRQQSQPSCPQGPHCECREGARRALPCRGAPLHAACASSAAVNLPAGRAASIGSPETDARPFASGPLQAQGRADLVHLRLRWLRAA